MSCQQLIQEDPYIFTDTVSNSTSFMHENNSQTKYVPLNRQTIYNRQFRQHEPKIASQTDSNNSILNKSTTYSDNHPHHPHNKIVISPTTKSATTLKERKNNNELNNGKILNARTSPKFFKSHQNQQQECNNHSKSNLITLSHSNASVSKSNNRQKRDQLQQQRNKNSSDILLVNHLTLETLKNGITGIKKEKEEVNDIVLVNKKNIDGHGVVKNEENKFDKVINIKTEESIKFCDGDNDDKTKIKEKKRKINGRKKEHSNRKFCLKKSACDSNLKNVIVEPISEVPRHDAPLVQLKLNVIDKSLLQNCTNNQDDKLSRDERLSMRKMQLRHVLNQYKGINRLRDVSTERYKSQLSKSFKLCKLMELEKQKILKKSIKICGIRDCNEEAIILSDFCVKHILLTDKEQFLIRQCCFRYLDGQQCRVPVNNILATIAVCNEHFNAPAHQLISSDSIEPKKNPVQRKLTKTCPLIRPVKSKGKASVGRKKKMPALIAQSSTNIMMPAHRPTMIIHPNDLQKQPIKNNGNAASITTLLPLKQENLYHQNESEQFIHFNSGNLLASSQSSYGSMSSGNEDLYIKQDLMPTVCENSYESSEDTGVGGLSENELISHDVIDTFDMVSCAELSKVLSSLPSNTLDDLLTEPLHTPRDDDEYLDRAIEEVSASGMDQIAITAFDHLEGLDMLELDDDEQRQMISAATNLISMSGYMHDQDNYSAMPSPMMS